MAEQPYSTHGYGTALNEAFEAVYREPGLDLLFHTLYGHTTVPECFYAPEHLPEVFIQLDIVVKVATTFGVAVERLDEIGDEEVPDGFIIGVANNTTIDNGVLVRPEEGYNNIKIFDDV